MARPLSLGRIIFKMTNKHSEGDEVQPVVSRQDLMMLTKARLSTLVVVTTLFGYLLGAKKAGFDGWLLVHTLIGTILCACAAAVYNQILEIDSDRRMARTADRPLAARRMAPEVAFVLGWILAGLGILHLVMKVNLESSALAAATIAVYIFIYTPLKSRSSTNTLVGAVSGALPPLIGWAAAGQALMSWEALFLFGLLFFWQLPHFLAINWLYREQYEKGGFVMWSNGDVSGKKTATLATMFSVMMLVFMFLPMVFGLATNNVIGAVICTGILVYLSLQFYRRLDRSSARRLFFATLIYLPVILVNVLISWR